MTSTQTYIENKLNHVSVCAGDRICKKCGRRGCKGCILDTTISGDMYPPEKIGLCVICAGTWKEDKILLYPPRGEWDEEENVQI